MEIRLARQGRHVAIVTIDNQPRLNAMTRAMLAELGLLWDGSIATKAAAPSC